MNKRDLLDGLFTLSSDGLKSTCKADLDILRKGIEEGLDITMFDCYIIKELLKREDFDTINELIKLDDNIIIKNPDFLLNLRIFTEDFKDFDKLNFKFNKEIKPIVDLVLSKYSFNDIFTSKNDIEYGYLKKLILLDDDEIMDMIFYIYSDNKYELFDLLVRYRIMHDCRPVFEIVKKCFTRKYKLFSSGKFKDMSMYFTLAPIDEAKEIELDKLNLINSINLSNCIEYGLEDYEKIKYLFDNNESKGVFLEFYKNIKAMATRNYMSEEQKYSLMNMCYDHPKANGYSTSAAIKLLDNTDEMYDSFSTLVNIRNSYGDLDLPRLIKECVNKDESYKRFTNCVLSYVKNTDDVSVYESLNNKEREVVNLHMCLVYGIDEFIPLGEV